MKRQVKQQTNVLFLALVMFTTHLSLGIAVADDINSLKENIKEQLTMPELPALEMLREQIGADNKQIEKLRQAILNYQAANNAQHKELAAKQGQLRQEIDRSYSDEKKVYELLEQISVLQLIQKQIHYSLLFQVRDILTDSQFSALRRLNNQQPIAEPPTDVANEAVESR